MEESQSKFEFIAGETCLDFLNTQIVQRGQPVDLLESFADLLDWLVEAGLVDRKTAVTLHQTHHNTPQTTEALHTTLTFRQQLRHMIDNIITGQPVASQTIDQINQFLRLQTGHVQIVSTDQQFQEQFVPVLTQPMQVLGLLAQTAVHLLCHTNHSRIEQCHNPNCILYFYDSSKNHSRRWCSMESCGNRMKAAAYYRKQKKAGPS